MLIYDEEVVLIDPSEDKPYISVHELLSGGFTEWMDIYEKSELKKMDSGVIFYSMRAFKSSLVRTRDSFSKMCLRQA